MAATQPDSYDIADIEYWICKKVWPTGNLQAMDVSKIANYDKIVGIFRNGKLTPESTIAQGTAPHSVGFVEGPGGTEFVAKESGWMTLIPTIYNADTLGIRPDLIGRPIESWAELLNPEFKGKASILDISSIGIMDMAMVCEAMGVITYGDKGNMTQAEIDKTIGDLHRGQARRPVPRLLEVLRRIGEPDGLGRGGDPVDVVARDHRRPRAGRALRVSAAEGRLP